MLLASLDGDVGSELNYKFWSYLRYLHAAPVEDSVAGINLWPTVYRVSEFLFLRTIHIEETNGRKWKGVN